VRNSLRSIPFMMILTSMETSIDNYNLDTRHVARAVLITGGAGYIGSHTCKMLRKNGFVPIVLDRNMKNKLQTSDPSFDVNIPTNIQAVDEIVKRYQIKSCIHLAGTSNSRDATKNPAVFYKNNFIGTMSLLDKLLECGVENFVFSSTASVYGNSDLISIPETALVDPLNAYASSKLATEKMIEDYTKAYGLKSVVLRYFNVAGHDNDDDLNECTARENQLVQILINCARQGKNFDLYGDGSAVRDYVHVTDVAEANIRALVHCINGCKFTTLNIGSGIGTTNKAVIDAVERYVGKIYTTTKPKNQSEINSSVADITKAKEILDWEPTQSSIDNVVATAVKWYNKTHKKEIQ
jgi:UDP-glucose-4-epimerase GalE